MTAPNFDRTIPSTFQRLDTNVSAADSYVNVRDLQTIVENHNVLVAEATKRQLVTQNLGWTAVYTCRPATKTTADLILSWPLFISPETQSLQITLMAYKPSSSYANVTVYPVLDGPGQSFDINTSGPSMSISQTAATSAAGVTVPVPRSCRGARGVLALYFGGTVTGADILGASANLTFAGPSAVQVDQSVSVNDALYIDTDSDVEARLITKVDNLGGGSYLAFLDAPFNKGPAIGTDTAQTRLSAGLVLVYVEVHENIVTDFTTTVEIP